MFDVMIRGGFVVDGSGRPGSIADIGILGDRIALVGRSEGAAAKRTFNAEGLTVSPGFIDLHTHFDAQLFWDSYASPSLLHGTTTVMSGNCGFTLAPMYPRNRDYLLRMMAKVEGIPSESLFAGLACDWRSFPDWLERLSSKPLAINVGALVGHSALRLAVMGEAAIGGKATDVQVEEMKILLKEALTAGAFGFSSTTYMGHRDAAGDHIPSFWAQPDEIVALASVLKDSKAPALGFNPTVGAFGTEHFDLMTRMSIAAARPLNWNLLNVDSKRPEIVSNQMSASDYARERGGRVVALTMPAPTPLRRSYLGGGFGLDALPGGWHEIWAKPPEERVRDLSDPNIRKRLAAGAAQKGADPLGHRTNWGSLTVADGYAPEVQKYRGRLISDIAKESGRTPLDVLFDILVADKMRTSFTGPRPGDDEDSWGLRPEVWRKKDVVLGGADAGAHLDVMCGASYTTRMLSEAIRKRKLIALEEAVHLLTDVPARLYDLKDRGLIEQNRFADLVVFDPNTVGPTDDVVRTDMPAAQERIYCGSTGIHAVFVNGSQVVDQGEHTQAHSGKLLRPTEDCAGRIALH